MSSYKYYKSDFAVIVNIGAKYTDNAGQVRALSTEVPFKFRFYTPLKGNADESYEATSDGAGNIKNCAILNDHQVLVFVDLCQHDFALGDLMLEAEFIIDDVHYEGDDECNIMRLYNTGIVLTDQPDLDTEGQMTVDIYDAVLDESVRLRATQAATNAINTTLQPKINEVNGLITSFTTAENARVSAENSRVSAENARVAAESSRATTYAALKKSIEDWYAGIKSDWSAWFIATKSAWETWFSGVKTAWDTWFTTTKSAWKTFNDGAAASETARVSAEDERIEAESARVQAEANRVVECDEMIERLKDITVVDIEERIYALEKSATIYGTSFGEDDEIDGSVWDEPSGDSNDAPTDNQSQEQP